MQSSPPPGPLGVGDLFLDRFQILGVIGRGGFGCVYRGRDNFMGRDVAIKVLLGKVSSKDEAFLRGKQEAVILGQLEHSNIVKVHEGGRTPEGHLYIVMELLQGIALNERLRTDGPFGVVQGLEILEALCAAFECAHQRKIFHRDIKPGNIFICDNSPAKILDFGIAKVAGSTGFQTAPNMVVGTSLYVSPEQIRSLPATHLSDIYSLGLVAFQIFHGSHPLLVKEPNVNIRNPKMIWELHMKTIPPTLNEVIPGFPKYVAKLVHTALAKDPGQRFQSMQQLGEAATTARIRYQADQGVGSFIPSQKPSRASERPPEHRENSQESERQRHVASVQTAPVAKRATKRMFGDLDPANAPALASIRESTFERSPSQPPPEPRPQGTRYQDEYSRDESEPARAQAERPRRFAPNPLTPQSAARTITIPGIPTRFQITREHLMFAALAILGCSIGVALLFVIRPLAPSTAKSSSDEIVIESVQATTPAPARPVEPPPVPVPEPTEAPAPIEPPEPEKPDTRSRR